MEDNAMNIPTRDEVRAAYWQGEEIFSVFKQKPCTICVQSCPFKAVAIKDSEECVRLNPGSFTVMRKEERCEECEECFCLLYCPINEIISTDIFGVREVMEKKRTVEGCNTCFICRGTPACLNMNAYRGLKQITSSFFYCFLIFSFFTSFVKAIKDLFERHIRNV
jgi:NAD-dependent dihydropyrimidine dehydrogenase PreA subunit